MHPLRLQYEMFSRANPFMDLCQSMAGDRARTTVSRSRRTMSFWQAQERCREWIETSLDAYRDMRDQLVGGAVPQRLRLAAAAGARRAQGLRRDAAPAAGSDAAHRAFVAKRIDELKRNIGEGGPREAAIRALSIFACRRAWSTSAASVCFAACGRKRARTSRLAEFKKLVREQFFSLLLDERRAVEAIPAMLAKDPELASRMARALGRLIEVVGVESAAGKARLREMEKLFKQRPVPAIDSAGGAQPARGPGWKC